MSPRWTTWTIGADRAGAATIATELNADEVSTRTGRRLFAQAVLCILRNRGYLGEVSFRDVTYQHGDPVLFDKAQTLLAERGEAYDPRMRQAHPEYLLTGLIVCGRCGRNYVGVAAAGRGHRYGYYACFTHPRHGKDACTGERMRADVIEAAVLDAILAVYADPELIERAVAMKAHEVANSAQLHQDQIAATKAELRKTEAAIERYVHAFESGTLSDDMFRPRVRELGDRVRTLQARHDELTEAAIAAAADPRPRQTSTPCAPSSTR